MSYSTYIIKSCSANFYYFGHCKDFSARLANHNSGKVRSTKGRRPWIIHYVEEFQTKSEVYRREMFFKSLEGRKWLIDNNIISPR